jgi:hypothetical protein
MQMYQFMSLFLISDLVPAGIVYAAVERLSSALYSQEYAQYYAAAATSLPELSATSAKVERRLSASQANLASVLRKSVADALAEAGWPLPLLKIAENARGEEQCC